MHGVSVCRSIRGAGRARCRGPERHKLPHLTAVRAPEPGVELPDRRQEVAQRERRVQPRPPTGTCSFQHKRGSAHTGEPGVEWPI
ncbi:hypothetical protein NDU88_005041 [Pleurodeles waltl]|uniref:Uncharacterized protein n=1 Tax=Pleurodeles waltl TaxID=8319 RepID=A0AAV7SKN7_PLEWA|nr:hypothetical protein NDU88_005041 [Pleurodeles waltl]